MNRNTSKDIQIAEDVGKKAELGWFAVEFTAYGCAWLDREQNKMFYKVSSKAEDIYEFIEKGAQNGIYPGNIMRYTQKCPVPAGAKNLIEQAVKISLAKKLRETYPKAFFEILYRLAEQCTDNSADSMLWEQANVLEAVFDEEKLNRFSLLVDYAYSCCRLDRMHYQKLTTWIAEERSNMYDNCVNKDIFEKTMHGIGYLEKGILKHTENAIKACIYEKIYDLEQQGILVTPVLSKTYWYNYTYRLPCVIRDFREKLICEYNADYLVYITQLRSGTGRLAVETMQQAIVYVEKCYGRHAAETLTRYGHRWNVI